MKPVSLMEQMIKNSSHVGNLVFEPFAGSGTTLVACHQQQRKCKAVELEPRFVAVCIERIHVLTGIMPTVERRG